MKKIWLAIFAIVVSLLASGCVVTVNQVTFRERSLFLYKR